MKGEREGRRVRDVREMCGPVRGEGGEGGEGGVENYITALDNIITLYNI